MKIRMLVQMPDGAARNGQPWPAQGEDTELPTAEAAHLVASGVAEEVGPPGKDARPRARRKTAAGEEE
ncbi:hypothetical protein [Streptomyces sp. SID12501]|uniref:Uncharacterized protein n=1 Tax=Streptomyces sp. SID12501 TaxID=2706042 RepID=A0A6B3C238_9ACTN|nr:hypothetical protein [Streptomyces sp. SID12501]NEC90472.1 hypothetical protein [Streptomyces sp. SID12501]